MADRLAENGAIQYALANPEAGSKRAALSGYIMGALNDWLRSPFPPSSRLAAPGRLRGKFFDSGIAPLAMDFTSGQYASGSAGTMAMKSFSDIITFSRTSNATITKSDGTIGYAPHNLLTYSEQFDNAAWNKQRASITANSVLAPDGTTTADTITEDSTASETHLVTRAITTEASTYTYSVYLKANTRNWVALWMNTAGAYFNLSDGTVGTVSSGVTANITSVGNGWYRCSTTRTMTAASNSFYVYMASANNSVIYTGNGTGSIYLWGAQLEVGASPTTYNSTTVKNLLGYSELFDNAAWTKSNSFVQTNLLTYSEAFDNAAWTKSNVSLISNSTIAPNGYQTAYSVVEAATSSVHSISSGGFGSGANNFTVSVYLKANTRNFGYLNLYTDGGANRYTIVINLINATITSTNSAGTPILVNTSATLINNGWVRASITLTNTSGSCFSTFGISDSATPTYAGVNPTYTGNGTSGIYAWGAQLVQGSVAGDYRRTDAAALPVYYPNHNGVVCAEKLVPTSTSIDGRVSHAVAITTISGTYYTASIYAKAGENSELNIVNNITGTFRENKFNLTNGTITSQGTGNVASISSVGNGWYRCSVTAISGTTSTTIQYRNSNTGDGTSGIYIFGAQLSDSASLDPYVLNAGAAPSAQAYYGARFDYDPVTLQPKGLLIEEQRVNLLLNSSLAGTNLATQNITTTAAARTLSFYGTGTVTLSGTHSATVVGTGAYPTRTTYTYTPTAGTLTLTVSGTVQYAQDELGSFATSFIPTAGASVTRAADVAVIQGSNFYSWYNQNEGSVSAKVSSLVAGNFQIDDGTANNRITYINRLSGTGTVSSAIVNSAGVVDLSVSGWTSGVNNIAAGYKVDNYAGVINNGTVVTDTSAGTPIVNTLRISGSTTTTANVTFKSISYCPQRLSSDVLKGLTA